jgi:hypothetical protein
MNDEISQKIEELRFLKNDTLDCDRQKDLVKEEIKKFNKNISDLNVNIFFSSFQLLIFFI